MAYRYRRHITSFITSFSCAAACLLAPAAASAQDISQTILPQPGSLHAWFGYTLAVDGTTLIAGDNQYRPNDGVSCGGAGYGAVDVYKKSGSNWEWRQIFLHTPGTIESMFGKVVSLKGNVFVTSAEREPNGSIWEAGAFFVYRRATSSADFTQLAKKYAPTPTAGARFTMMGGLATNGTYIAAADSPSTSFNIYVYQIVGSSVNHVSTITPPTGVVGQRLFITDQNVLVVTTNGLLSGPLAYRLNGSSVTQIDTTSLNHNFYFTAPYMTGDGNTVALYKRFGSTGAFRPQIVKFTSTGIEWSEFLQLPMNYDGLDELASPGHHPSGLALEEGKGLFVTYPGSSEPFVLAYKYSGSRYRPAGVFRVGLNHVFPTSGRFAESVAFNGTDLFIGDTGYVTTPGGPIYCTNPGTVGYIKVMQPLATNIGGPDGSTKLQPWLTSTISDLGAFVATDGTYALGGSAWDQDAHNTWGEVTLFQNLGGGAWEHVERFIDGWSGWEGKSGWGAFGTSADINNDFLVIGAPNAVSGWDEVRSGAVYIARKVNGVFEAGPVLTPEYGIPGTPVGSYFGHAVALTGNTLAIGTPDWNNPPSRGSVWIYNYNGTNDWISNEVLGPNVASGQDWEAFGYAVDASGNNLIVGIPYRSSNGRTYAGAIQIFRRNTTTGFYTSMLEANAPSSWPAFSYHGATVSIGADWAAAAGGTGSVVIYRRSTTTGAWTQNTVITPNPAQNGFGYSVAIEGTRLVVGSPFENKVHRYERAFNGTWPWGGSITGPGGSTGFGASVAFRNGNVAIGDHSATSGTASSNTGAVYFTSFTGI